MSKAKSKDEQKPEWIDPLKAWEAIRGHWFHRIKNATGSYRMAERELFCIVKDEFQRRYPKLEIPYSAYQGVTRGIRTEASELRWHDLEGFREHVAALQIDGNCEAGEDRESVTREIVDAVKRGER